MGSGVRALGETPDLPRARDRARERERKGKRKGEGKGNGECKGKSKGKVCDKVRYDDMPGWFHKVNEGAVYMCMSICMYAGEWCPSYL